MLLGFSSIETCILGRSNHSPGTRDLVATVPMTLVYRVISRLGLLGINVTVFIKLSCCNPEMRARRKPPMARFTGGCGMRARNWEIASSKAPETIETTSVGGMGAELQSGVACVGVRGQTLQYE